MKPAWIVCLIVLLGAGLAFVSCDRTPSTPPKNLIIITVDTTRADRLGCYGYEKAQTPNLDALAKEGTRFANATSHIALTLPSHSSIFTGCYPLGHGVHDNVGFQLPPEAYTLAEHLKKNGYQTSAFIAAKVLLARFGINQGFDHFDEHLPEKKPSRNAEQVLSSAKDWFKQQKKSPFFSWIHLYDPHLPYEHPEPFLSQFSDDPYSGEIAYMDAQLGQFFYFLKQQQLYENSIIIVVGDHGESLGEHLESTHGYFAYKATTHVPMLLKPASPVKTKSVVESRVRLIDIMPTSLKLLNFEIPKSVQGNDLTPLLFDQTPSLQLSSYSEAYLPFYKYDFTPIHVFRNDEYTFVDDFQKQELYDLKNDPKEKVNIIENKPEVAKALQEKLKLLVQTYSIQQDSLMKMDAEIMNALSALGYSHNTIRDISEGKDNPSAIENVIHHDNLISAGADISQKNFELAEQKLNKTLIAYPHLQSAYENMATLYFRWGKYEQALEYLQKMVHKTPEDTLSLQKMAMCYYALKQPEKSHEMLKKILEMNPDYRDARENLWKFYLNTKHLDLLENDINACLKRNLSDEFAWFWKGNLLRNAQKWEEALACYQKASSNKEFAAKSFFEMAKIYRDSGRQPQAQEAFQKSIKLDPYDINSTVTYGALLLQLKQEETALTYFKKALTLEMEPNQAENLKNYLMYTHIEIGKKHFEKQPGLALNSLEEALQYAPKNWSILQYVIQLKMKLHQKEDAYQMVLKAISDEDIPPIEHLKMIVLLETLEKSYEALNHIMIFVQKYPKEKRGHLYLGQLSLQLQIKNQAIEGFSKFLELHPEQDATREQVEAVLKKLQGN